MKQDTTRRRLLRSLAGLPLLAVGLGSASAAPSGSVGPTIARLIAQSRKQGGVSARMAFISHELLGVRYQGYTLIGGPKRPEVFVVRDDAFDCVTFCEFVLAAAVSHDAAAFEPSLRRIRYDHGRVQWNRRNHLFADWCERNVENGMCSRVELPGSMTVAKTMDAVGAPGQRHWSIPAVPPKALVSHRAMLAAGDIVGFVSHRSDLDYFHTGLIAFAPDGSVLLRNASQAHRRVLNEDFQAFASRYGVRHVTVLRPAENPPAA